MPTARSAPCSLSPHMTLGYLGPTNEISDMGENLNLDQTWKTVLSIYEGFHEEGVPQNG